MSDQGSAADMEQPRILPGSRRPDGTYRKERRVRPGYVPQEEQAVYVSAGKQYMASIPKCPGLDPAEAVSTPQGPQSKAAKKNAKRKAKQAEGQDTGEVNAATQQLEHLSTQDKQPAAGSSSAHQPAQQADGGQSSTAAVPSTSSGAESQAATLEKQIKGLAKKVRQSESLAERQAAGAQLSADEAAKAAKLASWKEELRSLEVQLSKMGGKQGS